MDVKARGLTSELHSKLQSSSVEEDGGISSVEVKFVALGKNTDGEGTLLGYY